MHHTFPCNRLTFSSHPLHPPYTPYWQAHDLPGEERGINGIGPSIVHSRHLPMYRPNGQYSLLPTEPSLFFLGERLRTIFVNARIQHTQHIAISTLIFYLTFSINLHHYPPAFLPRPLQLPTRRSRPTLLFFKSPPPRSFLPYSSTYTTFLPSRRRLRWHVACRISSTSFFLGSLSANRTNLPLPPLYISLHIIA